MRIGRVLVLAAGMVLGGPALADAIDGEWCSLDGSGHLKIEGSLIETPGGTATTGNYDRHAFTYVIPEGDIGAGAEVRMRLRSEEEVTIWFDPEKPETWRRCKPIA